jgi:hypothetical protein
MILIDMYCVSQKKGFRWLPPAGFQQQYGRPLSAKQNQNQMDFFVFVLVKTCSVSH